MATVVFHPVGKPKEVMQLQVEATNRVDATNEWLVVMVDEGLNPEHYCVIGVKGIPNKYQMRLEEEWRRRDE